jgi:hypothetical protein
VYTGCLGEPSSRHYHDPNQPREAGSGDRTTDHVKCEPVTTPHDILEPLPWSETMIEDIRRHVTRIDDETSHRWAISIGAVRDFLVDLDHDEVPHILASGVTALVVGRGVGEELVVAERIRF